MTFFSSALTLLLACFSMSALAMPTVTVLADNNLSIAISELARAYSKQAGIMVNTSFADQRAHQQQIDDGGEADILITTRRKWLDELKMQGVVDVYSERNIAQNRLALVSGSTSSIAQRSDGIFPLNELLKYFMWEPSFIVGNPDTLDEGVYSKEALRNLDVASDLEEYTLYVRSRGDMERMMQTQNMVGLLFYSSVKNNPGLKLIDLLPATSHSAIDYIAVAIAGDNMDEARKFLEFLSSDSAKELLRNHGFYVN